MNVIELYEFKIGVNRSFFTSAAQDIEHGGETYTAVPMSRSSISISSDSGGSITVSADRNHPVALLYRHSAPSDPVEIIVSSLNGSTKSVLWTGYVGGCKWTAAGVDFECLDTISYASQLALPQRYTRNCRHILYSEDCGVLRNSYRREVNITDIDHSNRTVTFVTTGLPIDPDEFAGGIMGNSYQVISVTGTGTSGNPAIAKTLRLDTGIDYGLTHIYRGCDRTRETCKNRFNNIENYGGFAHLPFNNPVTSGVDEGETS